MYLQLTEENITKVLADWASLNKIASIFAIDSDEVFERVFIGRKIIRKKIHGDGSIYNYIMLYKELQE